MIEVAIFMPFLAILLVGMFQLARVTYTYYALRKVLYTTGQYLARQQGVNFCDDGDATITEAKILALVGSQDIGAEPLIVGLTPDQISVRAEQIDANGVLTACDCSSTGCDTASGGQPPRFIVVQLPNGYLMNVRFGNLVFDNIPLQPTVRVPYGGT